jgi:hypothetical protein
MSKTLLPPCKESLPLICCPVCGRDPLTPMLFIEKGKLRAAISISSNSVSFPNSSSIFQLIICVVSRFDYLLTNVPEVATSWVARAVCHDHQLYAVSVRSGMGFVVPTTPLRTSFELPQSDFGLNQGLLRIVAAVWILSPPWSSQCTWTEDRNSHEASAAWFFMGQLVLVPGVQSLC